jgi:cell wall-associated NlpC family hydrolase
VAIARALPRLRIARIAVALSTVIVSLLVIVVPATPAQAKPSVSDIQKQIDAANNKLEPIIEDYDQVHSLLQADQAKAAALETKLQPLQLQVTVATSALAPMATEAYKNGPGSTLSLMLNSDSTASLLDQMGIVDEIAHERQRRIAAVVATRDKYAAAKRKLDTTLSSLAAKNADLSAKKQTIEKQVNALQVLRRKVYSDTGPIGTLRPVPCPVTYIGGAAGVAARAACSKIGKPYVWAAAGPNSFDCSGLTLWAWAQAGKTLRHYTKWQWADGTPISRSQLRPGDLVFFFPPTLHHVGMYVGGGWMVNAPDTGDYVRMAKITKYPIAGYRRP